MSACLVYLTAPNLEEARDLANKLVSKRLVACANILPSMTSVYHWEGKVVEDSEVVILLKTRSQNFTRIEEFILNHHSYEVPCIIQLDAGSIHKPYLDWLNSQIAD